MPEPSAEAEQEPGGAERAEPAAEEDQADSPGAEEAPRARASR